MPCGGYRREHHPHRRWRPLAGRLQGELEHVAVAAEGESLLEGEPAGRLATEDYRAALVATERERGAIRGVDDRRVARPAADLEAQRQLGPHCNEVEGRAVPRNVTTVAVQL